MRRILTFAVFSAAMVGGCDESAVQVASDSGSPVYGLTAEQADRVVARIGERVITLGDFGRALERMDQFDRLRYQTKERRRELLSEMVDVELLAMEAKRKGLDKDPQVQDAIHQVLREAILAQARQGLPAPAEISAERVRAYYEANADKFNEPERRRVAAIVMDDKKEAARVLTEAIKANDATSWGDLYYKYSLTAPKTKNPNAPKDLAGDLGVVGPPDDARGANPSVPEPVREAVFKIDNIGAVANQVIEFENKFYIVRMNGRTAGHQRSLAEADRSIRITMLQQMMRERERDLEEELKKKFPVVINEAALSSVKLPEPLMNPSSGASPPIPSGSVDAPDDVP